MAGLLAAPILGNWLAHKGCQAYHHGFVDPLAAQPRQVILSVVHAHTTATIGRSGEQPDHAATADVVSTPH